MKPSRKYLSLPIISLHEGQKIGYVKSLILDAATKSLAAIVVDSKGFFKDQRIIPYTKIVSVGDDAITIDSGSHVEKTSSLPELLDLVKKKLTIIGTKMVTETGETLGTAEEYYIDSKTGKITQIEISGGMLEGLFSGKAWISADYIMTIGHDVIIAAKGSESVLTVAEKGLSETFKNLVHSTSSLASETTHSISSYFKKPKAKTVFNSEEKAPVIFPEDEILPTDDPEIIEIMDIDQSVKPLG